MVHCLWKCRFIYINFISWNFTEFSIISRVNSDTYFFSIWSIYFLVWFLWLGFLRCKRISKFESVKSEHPCLASHLRGNAFTFSPFINDMVCRFVQRSLYFVEVCSLYTHFVDLFYNKFMFNLSEAFSASTEMIIWFLFFNLLCGGSHWFMVIEPPILPFLG